MYNDTVIRIKSIEISNIKNVEHGKVDLDHVEDDDSYGASVVGIYGQNGSGKTALIWAVDFIKHLISGEQLPADSGCYILLGKDSAKITAVFSLTIHEREYMASYEVNFKHGVENKVEIFDERLSFSSDAVNGKERINKNTIISISGLEDNVKIEKCYYGPDKFVKELSNTDKQKLLVIQALCKEKNVSYFFGEQILGLLKSTLKDEISYQIVDSLLYYGRLNLFVLNKNSDSSFNMNLLPLSMRIKNENVVAKSDGILIGLGKNTCDVATFKEIKKIIEQIDFLTANLVPGLRIEIVKVENSLDAKSKPNVSFELASNRNGVKTPLRYESEGIKKILCVLSSLIAMYNDPSIFVAIDELDSGVFEYLLGEFLDVINKTGKGQLLFTSHNMRPLEVLSNSNIYFTTTNPNNKFIQFTGIKENNNLRSTFLRTIDLGGQKESVYDSTSSYQIGKAFRTAGEFTYGRK